MAQSNHQIVIRLNYVIRLLEALGRGIMCNENNDKQGLLLNDLFLLKSS